VVAPMRVPSPAAGMMAAMRVITDGQSIALASAGQHPQLWRTYERFDSG